MLLAHSVPERHRAPTPSFVAQKPLLEQKSPSAQALLEVHVAPTESLAWHTLLLLQNAVLTQEGKPLEHVWPALGSAAQTPPVHTPLGPHSLV